MKILIAEDDKEINELISEFLISQGYETVCVFNGLEAVRSVHEQSGISLVLLDLMLPFKSGDAVLSKIREFSKIPVIVVSAKDTIQTKIDVIRMGADDYITKPFDLDELLARTEAVLRRCSAVEKTSAENILRFRELVIDRNSAEVRLNGKVLSLTSKEYAILELMLSNPTKLFSKANLFESVWNEPYFSDENTIKVHMSNLRNKLKEASPDEEYIETVWGMGYKLRN